MIKILGVNLIVICGTLAVILSSTETLAEQGLVSGSRSSAKFHPKSLSRKYETRSGRSPHSGEYLKEPHEFPSEVKIHRNAELRFRRDIELQASNGEKSVSTSAYPVARSLKASAPTLLGANDTVNPQPPHRFNSRNQGVADEINPLIPDVLSSTHNNGAQEILDFLEKGEKIVQYQPGKDVVFLLGLTGTGKSTLALFISGHDNQLISHEVLEDSGDFIIKDTGGSVSGEDSTTQSWTTFPQLFTDAATDTPIYDCPGFSDNRGAKNDIAATFFIKKVLEGAGRVKFIFTISHHSVSAGIDRSGYLDLAKHATDLIQNVEKFKDSVAIMVTKVENRYLKGGKLVSDEKTIETIANFLRKARDAKKDSKDPADMKIVKFTDVLLKQNENKKSVKIGIFRKPDEPGPLNKIQLMQECKKSLKKAIHDNTQYARHEPGDFGYTLSPESQLKIVSLTEQVHVKIVSNIISLREEIERYYLSKENELSDAEELRTLFQVAYNALSSIKVIKEPQIFVKQITEIVENLNIIIPSNIFEGILKNVEYLAFFKSFNEQQTEASSQWTQEFSTLIKYLDDSKTWYSFLMDLFSSLSDYGVQQDISRYEKGATVLKKEVQNGKTQRILESLKLFLKSVRPQSYERDYDRIKGVMLTESKLQKLDVLLDFTLLSDTEVSYNDEDKRLIVKGHFVKLSEVAENLHSDVKFVDILSLEKVFVNADLDLAGKYVQASIIAPHWEILDSSTIKLNGEIGKPYPDKARDGMGPGNKGDDGKPGNPGSSAGNFIGFADKITGTKNLRISVVGGKGGNGQKGGKGGNGKDGTRPGPRREYERNWPDSEFQCTNPETVWHGDHHGNIMSFKGSDCTVNGKDCTDGSDGGNGGKGGRGGKAGRVIAIEFGREESMISTHTSQEAEGFDLGRKRGIEGIDSDYSHQGSLVVTAISQGENGRDGEGGNYGEKGRPGYTQTFHLETNALDKWTKSERKSETERKRCSSGKNGVNGNNTRGMQNASIVEILTPWKTVNSYKLFARENIKTSFRGSSLRNFIDVLEKHQSIIDLYDTHGFLDELYGLEKQFGEISLRLLPYYTSLLDRIIQFAKTLNDKNELSKRDKKVLGVLYTTILSRVCTFKSNPTGDLIVNLKDHLNSVETNVNRLKESKNIQASYESYRAYNASLSKKMDEAQQFIDGQVSSDLDNTFDNMNNQVGLLVDEITALQNETEQKRDKLVKKQEELKSQMLLKNLLGGLKIASMFLSFAGPVGKTVGEVIDGAATVADSLACDESSNDSGKVNALPPAVNAGSSRLKKDLENDQQLLKEQLIDAAKLLKEFSSQHASPILKEVEAKITEIQKQLEAIIKKGDTLDPAARKFIQDERKELQEFMSKKLKELAASKSSAVMTYVNADLQNKNDSSKNESQVLENVSSLLKIADTTVNYYKQIRKDRDKVNELADAIEKAGEQLRQLAEYKEAVYNILLPAVRNIEKSIHDAVNNLKGRSHSFLDVGKWQVQRTIRSMKNLIQKMTKGMKIEDEFVESVAKLEEGMNLMIDLYDRIQDYRDKAEQAAYISDTTSASATSIKVDNPELQAAINNLRSTTLSNLVLQEYESAFKAFKQYVFPFASFFLTKYRPPPFPVANDTDSLIADAINKIHDMKDDLAQSFEKNKDYHEYVHNGFCFKSTNQKKKPFYVWKHEDNKHIISDLLDGKEVFLKADVTRGVASNAINHYAIKFNFIGLRFNLSDDTSQRDFDQKLLNFDVIMTHTGNSYYRCQNQIYVISSPQQVLKFSFSKGKNGIPDDTNDMYDHLRTNVPILSPYAMWRIQLTQEKNDFRSLADYKKKPIDLELQGQGQYTDSSTGICTEDLQNYYKLDRTSEISALSNVELTSFSIPGGLDKEC